MKNSVKHTILLLLTFTMLMNSCGEMQKILNSNDAELKYNKAVEYYNEKKYTNAITLFDDIVVYYRGTEQAELILNFLARAYLAKKDYYSASEYFSTYVKSYPRGRFIEEAKYMVAYSLYLDSPDVRLDQTDTRKAVVALNDFLYSHPKSSYSEKVKKYLKELNSKLAEKYLINAKLYYDLGTYLGNNYKSAVITAENGLKAYPHSIYKEELMFLILQAKLRQAEVSFEKLKQKRFRDAEDEYYNYINDFPSGKYRKKADKILAICKKQIKKEIKKEEK